MTCPLYVKCLRLKRKPLMVAVCISVQNRGCPKSCNYNENLSGTFWSRQREQDKQKGGSDGI